MTESFFFVHVLLRVRVQFLPDPFLLGAGRRSAEVADSIRSQEWSVPRGTRQMFLPPGLFR